VIPTLDRAPILARVLDRLPHDVDIVVGADAAERDLAAVERVAAGRARVVQATTPGVSAARNAAWRATDAEVVLCLGDDMLPAPGLVERHAAFHARHPDPEDALQGHVRWARELKQTAFMSWLDDGVQFDFGSIRGTRAGFWHLYLCHASLKRDRLERTGGHDETFRFGFEELELALRLDAIGFRLSYDPEAEVEHLHEPTLAGWRERMAIVGAAERHLVEKHPQVEPELLRRFEAAAAAPPASTRGARLARWVPRGAPVIGARVWFSADRWFAQQLAPAFLRSYHGAESPR
jgi:glycosyltransferase involved in cell wall biosynthesis